MDSLCGLWYGAVGSGGDHFLNDMRYDFFLAGRFRNKENILALLEMMRAKGKRVYCFLETEESHTYVGDLDCDPEAAMKQFEATQDWWHDPKVRAVHERDMHALRVSERFVLLLPAGKSGHMEAGAAYGMGKECFVVGEQKEAETLYLCFTGHFDTVEAFVENL